MMSYDFITTTHGKWILTGEHAVIRGNGALVFPINEKKLTLSYHQSTSELSANYEGPSGAETHLLFWSVLEQGMQLLDRSLNSLNGHFNLYSNIPIGVGMGASAALCVVMARWFAAQDMLPDIEINHFARELENLFHGQSSGLDIAGVAATTGMYFRQGVCAPIKQDWQPQWFLSSCGEVGMTSSCIKAVQALWQTDPMQARRIDQTMQNSVIEARSALEEKNTAQLAKAINHAANCFKQWGLISPSLQQHIETLRDTGAIAVKPTGSGGGGYVLSLWNGEVHNTTIKLIPV